MPATEEQPGGWPYFIRRARPVEFGGSCLHIATGIQRMADATLIAAAPDLTEVLLRLLTTPDLMRADLDSQTRDAVVGAWDLLVRVAPHLEIGS